MMTGEEYKASLNDGRKIYFEGRLVENQATEPAFAVAVQATADGYDKYYTSEPGAVNPMVTAPRSQDELRSRIPILVELDQALNVTYQSLMTLLVAAPRIRPVSPELAERIETYVEDAKLRDIRVTECITDAKGDRSQSPIGQEDPDAYVRVVERREDGVVVRGAKLHITAASLGHELMVMPTKKMKPGEEEWAIACAIPVNSPGVSIINTTNDPRGRDRRDYPVSDRLATPDGFVILDDVFVPWDRVFLDGQVEHAAVFAHSLGLWERLGGTSFMCEQADELVGLAHLIAEANGLSKVSHIREKIDEMMIHATMLRAGLEAALSKAHKTPEGYYYPDELYTNAVKYQGAANFNMMVRHLHDIAGGGAITAPSVADFDNPATAAYVEKYMQAYPAFSGRYRTQLFHAIRDLTADAHGGWHLVTNLQSGGGLFAQRLVTRKHYDIARARALALKVAGISGA
ncbi:4-hydroxybutyryl-CoA dehydratase/vinylacetyl-CoA-Delta-isomerase [Jatrophihabitans sp. GAS493]|uniref:4-hydroxyphenylacetate 3-hydroxylase N-terminal domain-containing protein n=1 Tax=Jatrophihabitans sp. GAS493 TaxID=1907575 RepID=UPI000BB82D7B|nr:4-hydroxyphenylacetate 3-hydroxylase N-terminal domain-containing protein [Jatrophihabitans sp. GAS493]SOD74621.1 4-hydroxybutyryl-CoA dehydratase/vinylacetyl-CoA-Delta-isomerase [Jatrophihabitans sp. GAS493]